MVRRDPPPPPVKEPKAPPEYRLVQMDAVEYLQAFAPGSVDCMITDPAYESLEKHRSRGTTTRLSHSKASSNDWFSIFPNARFPEFFEAAYRALARNAHMYVFSDFETLEVMKPIAIAAGFRWWKPIIWDKVAIGMGYHWRSRCEFISFYEKGKRKLNNLSLPDIITAQRVHSKSKLADVEGDEPRLAYPTEKTVDAIMPLVENSTNEGEWIVDPFLGSGSTGVAAVRQGRNFVGADLNPTALDLAMRRIEYAGGQYSS